jgi:hypothetical protein
MPSPTSIDRGLGPTVRIASTSCVDIRIVPVTKFTHVLAKKVKTVALSGRRTYRRGSSAVC